MPSMIVTRDFLDDAFQAMFSAEVPAPPEVDHFQVSAPPTVTLAVDFFIDVTALDVGNNVVTSYNGEVVWSSTDGSFGAPASPSNLVSGTGNFMTQGGMVNLGPQTVTVNDSVNSALTGTSDSIEVVL